MQNTAHLPGYIVQQVRLGFVKVLILGEVDEGLELPSGLEELVPPIFVGASQRAGIAPDGGPALLLRLCVQSVAQRLNLREIQAVVDESAFGELAWFGVADASAAVAPALGYGGQNGLDRRRAPVDMELQYVFAGDCFGRWKVEEQGL